jgi:hypothetical protein
MKANHFRVVVEIDESKKKDKDKWKGLAFDDSNYQHDISHGKGMIYSLFQAPMGSDTHNVIMSTYDYISTARLRKITSKLLLKLMRESIVTRTNGKVLHLMTLMQACNLIEFDFPQDIFLDFIHI